MKENKKPKQKDELDFEYEMEEDSQIELEMYKKMLQEAQAKNLHYEKFLSDQGLMGECNSQFVSPEEIICMQGIEYIKRLVIQGTFTKDDINAFDVLHRNLCLIRGIKVDKQGKKKDKPKTREELLQLVKKG